MIAKNRQALRQASVQRPRGALRTGASPLRTIEQHPRSSTLCAPPKQLNRFGPCPPSP
eukprot:CAMPEP_0119335082 /NCGR_PEP_ID=MMETSP1333-20130426/88638_1 /TAXON_ID=418940 /ORGANISM="Scyphosphaera apsteinii, Strain RCC1455" /LENGTH=57 /DNA_ID=CAMNT_0007345539 /DNA_START=28 /DNA_END=201 /DNA_ORIENTATION=+